MRLDVEVDAEFGFQVFDNLPAPLDAVGLQSLGLAFEFHRRFDAVAEQVDALAVGLDAEFDAVNQPDALAILPRRIEFRMEAVVVGDGDSIEVCSLRRDGHVLQAHLPVRVRRVRVEISDERFVGHTTRTPTTTIPVRP